MHIIYSIACLRCHHLPAASQASPRQGRHHQLLQYHAGRRPGYIFPRRRAAGAGRHFGRLHFAPHYRARHCRTLAARARYVDGRVYAPLYLYANASSRDYCRKLSVGGSRLPLAIIEALFMLP